MSNKVQVYWSAKGAGPQIFLQFVETLMIVNF